MDDSLIVDLFWKRDDQAIKKASQKYGSYCFSIAYNILHNREDSEECVNDTWLRAWCAIPPQRPANLQMYLARIIRNLSFDRFKSQNAEKRGSGEITLVLDELAECIPGESNVADEYAYKELVEAIKNYVAELPARECNVFLRRYFFADSIVEIAKRYHLTENNVMVILSRVRKKLKHYLQREGLLYGQK